MNMLTRLRCRRLATVRILVLLREAGYRHSGVLGTAGSDKQSGCHITRSAKWHRKCQFIYFIDCKGVTSSRTELQLRPLAVSPQSGYSWKTSTTVRPPAPLEEIIAFRPDFNRDTWYRRNEAKLIRGPSPALSGKCALRSVNSTPRSQQVRSDKRAVDLVP